MIPRCEQSIGTPHDPDQQLIVYTAESGSPSEQALRILASSAANEHEPARSLTD